MPSSRRRLLLIATALLGSLLIHDASAMGGGMGGGMGGEPPGGRQGGKRQGEDSEKQRSPSQSPFAGIARSLETAERELKLTPAQYPLWQRYQRRVEDLLDDQMRAPLASDAAGGINAITRKVDVVRNRLAAMEQIERSARALHAALTPEQQKSADALLPATVPALYSGLAVAAEGEAGKPGERGDKREPPPERN